MVSGRWASVGAMAGESQGWLNTDPGGDLHATVGHQEACATMAPQSQIRQQST